MLQKTDRFNQKYVLLFFRCFAFLLILYVFWKNAWASDDSFITMRVVDNFVNGYGLRWNVIERVQVFTHPLWLFVLTIFYLMLDDPYLTIYATSLAVSLSVISVLLFRFAKDIQTIMLISIMLISSHAFIDYSSSGLENPLTHLLIVSFAWIFLKNDQDHKFRFLSLTFVAGLAVFNRLDSVLLFVPALLYEAFRLRHQLGRVLWQGLLGVVPVFGWEIFSLVYYGFLFPNTYYAKLHTRIATAQLWKWGWNYVTSGWALDNFTYIVIALAFVLLFINQEWKLKMLFLGGIAYMMYFLNAGGDFMSGRFFSSIFLIAIIVLIELDLCAKWQLADNRKFIFVMISLLLLAFSNWTSHPLTFSKNMIFQGHDVVNGVADEKAYYYHATGWRNYEPDEISQEWAIIGNDAKINGEKYLERGTIGFLGYHAGPEVYIIDLLSLSDSFRARLPVLDIKRVGHYKRPYPIGYKDTIFSDFEQNLIKNPDLALYFDQLWIVINDDLFSEERFRLIWDLNTGKSDGLVEHYLNSEEWKNFNK